MSFTSTQKQSTASAHAPRHSAHNSKDALRQLEQLCQEMSNRIAVLEAGLYGVVAPLIYAFGLTPSEAQVLGHLLKRNVVSKEALNLVLYGLTDAPSEKSLDVVICKLRKKLSSHGIIISTVGVGTLTLSGGMKKMVTHHLTKAVEERSSEGPPQASKRGSPMAMRCAETVS